MELSSSVLLVMDMMEPGMTLMEERHGPLALGKGKSKKEHADMIYNLGH